ncbi:prepilin-type N-terminal cleavage/methylation domain-containing protein [bacterium]|nr:prepilin-type N-terminal cleavage/methylation domain-containing protein [bacterium]
MAPHVSNGRECRRCCGFTLLELLVAVAIIAMVAALLLPVLRVARIKARVARAHADLRSIATSIEAYRLDQGAYPIARAFCAGGGMKVDDYNECPPELLSLGYLGAFPEDVFNRGRAYKYIAPGLGYANNVLTVLAIWVPKKFPRDDGSDVPYFNSKDSPVKWAIWSVGPSGPKKFWESEALHYPVPQRNWYNFKNGPESEGVIVHLSTTKSSP